MFAVLLNFSFWDIIFIFWRERGIQVNGVKVQLKQFSFVPLYQKTLVLLVHVLTSQEKCITFVLLRKIKIQLLKTVLLSISICQVNEIM